MPDEIDALEELLARATPGPWSAHIEDPGWDWEGDRPAWVPETLTIDTSDGDMPNERDVRLVVALRNAAPELLAVVRAAAVWERRDRCCESAEAAATQRLGLCAPCSLGYALDALRARLREVAP